MRWAKLAAWTLACLLVSNAAAAEDQSESQAEGPAATPIDAIEGGGLLLQLRPRYAHVDQADKPKDADAYTMRTLLGWQSRPWEGLSGTAQLLNVGHLGAQHYTVSTSVPSPYPAVKEPDNTDFNHLFLDYSGLRDTLFRVGRQDLILDNERMVGIKNFSQTPQVFDAAILTNRSLSGTDLFLGYMWRERTTSATLLGSATWLFNVRRTFAPGSFLTGYAYLQDQPNTGQNTGFNDNSNKILGLRLDGAQPIREPWQALYTVELARQNSYADGDSRIDASYSRVGAGIQWKQVYLRADQERLGSNGGAYAFQTPIGSTHSFQGWADLFTTTPRQGVLDRFATLGAKMQSLTLYSEYHSFRSDFDDLDLGNELDVRLSYLAMKSLVAQLELADYRAGDPAAGQPDTRKIWLTLIYNY